MRCTAVNLCVLCVFVFVNSQGPVRVGQGLLQGTTQSTIKGREIYAFYNIPYAKPPTGEYRFKEPEPPGRWKGVRNATTPGNVCLQHITQSFQTTGVEDCLYLNVFTPVLPNETVNAVPPWLAVIVFFHNGVFITGDSSMFQPGYLLDEDVLLVTVNFRLGILGFLSTEDAVVPGNSGLKDQVAALKWVQENIQAFGGDCDRVTIAGNTAGAVSVHLHFLSPLSADLFQQGIVQSGSALVPWAISTNLREKTEFIASTLSCPVNDSQNMVDCLRTFSPKQLIVFTQSYEAFINTPFAPFGPCIEKDGDNSFLSESPFKLMQNGSTLDRPILFSSCESEGLYPLAGIVDNEDVLNFLDRRWTDVAPYLLNFNNSLPEILKPSVSQIIRDYYINANESISPSSDLRIVKLFSDRQFLVDNGRAASLQAKFSFLSSVYFYLFTYRGKNSYSEFYNPTNFGNYGAANGDDTLYIFEDSGAFFNASSDPQDLQMRELMTRLWASFAISGVPDIGNVTTWTPVSQSDFDTGSLTYLEIASPSDLLVKRALDFGNRTFWSSLPFDEPARDNSPYYY